MEKSLSYPGKFADADIKISRCCPCGEAEILKKASRISAKLKFADADIKISRRCPAGEPTVAVPSEAKEGKQC